LLYPPRLKPASCGKLVAGLKARASTEVSGSFDSGKTHICQKRAGGTKRPVAKAGLVGAVSQG